MSVLPFKVKAVYEYTSPHEDDLHFQSGQIITVIEEEDDDWYSGEYVDAEGVKQEGIFPRNFVEKFEPQAPPRPVRTARPKKEADQPTPVQPAVTELTPTQNVSKPTPEPAIEPVVSQAPVTIEKSIETTPPKIESVAPPAPKLVEKPSAPAQTAPKAAPPGPKPQAPAESVKPTGSFRDRIAAFNKSAAPPPAPFKPGGLGGGSGFIRKPFVPPPPSKNAYIPVPRDVPVAKIYRRDEDPEIAAREQENQENAERSGLAPTNQKSEEDQPKPTSLKERIALLQKQQAEQAARHADAAQKKEKPKRPTKKRADSHNAGEPLEGEEAPLEKQESHEAVSKHFADSSRDDASQQQPPRRKSSKGSPATVASTIEADGNDADMSGAGDETEEPDTGLEDSDANTTVKSHAPPPPARGPAIPTRQPNVGDEEDTTSDRGEEGEDEDDEEEEVDPEVRRREEIRARMAKMSGGMGMHGMFGPPGGMPMPMPGAASATKKKKATSTNDSRPSGEYGYEDTSPASSRNTQIPMLGLPSLSKVRTPEEMTKDQLQERVEIAPSPAVVTGPHEPEELPDVEDVVGTVVPGQTERRPAVQRSSMSHDSYNAPVTPGERPAPPPVPVESRPQLPPLAAQLSPSAGSESDDELSAQANLSVQTPTDDTPPRPTTFPSLPIREERHASPPFATTISRPNFGDGPTPVSPTAPGASKRTSRVPPIPSYNPAISSVQTRPPPPPPPAGSLSRSSTGDARFAPVSSLSQREETDEEVTEYEGDYDTDIASTAPHKDALKSQAKEANIDDESSSTPSYGHPSGPPPPLPPVGTPRSVPPPLPSQPPPHVRQSSDMPRAVPPPPPPLPPKHEGSAEYDEDEEYDPYKYTASRSSIPIGAVTIRKVPDDDDEGLYSSSPPRHAPPPHNERAPPPPPPREAAPTIMPIDRAPPPRPRDSIPPPTPRAPPRQSMDAQRTTGSTRRSTDLSRIPMDYDFMANDVDMGGGSLWWTNPSGVPPVFYGRKDLLHETEESTTSQLGGNSVTTKDLYVLFPDYSQTIITVQFDTQNPADASFEQRHEQPPSRPRQDQFEEAHERFGKRIQEAVVAKKESVVADGTPAGLIVELLKPLKDALLPVGTRTYGALVYSNQGNSLTSQLDEIRPGDIITLRNTKFQGKHGPMHAKYTAEVGKGEGGHVGVVAEWDGPKKKVRAWEQGRESRKVKLESFKLDDLRSGEVKIWRVMPRSWVGWQGQNLK